MDRDLIDPGFPYFRTPVFSRLWRTPAQSRFGYMAWDQPVQLCLVNWGALYGNLRKRVPEGVYRAGCAVADIRNQADSGVELRMADGSSFHCDLALCADGHSSLGRRRLFPKLEATYAGYVLWRGNLPEALLSEAQPLESGARSTGYPGGHGIFYFVPGPGGSIRAGQRLVNWGMYLLRSSDAYAALMHDQDGRTREHSLPPGSMPASTEQSLKDSIGGLLPDFYQEIVRASSATSVYGIYDLEVPAYRQGRVALLGDAGALARPHSAAGALKSMNDAISLASALREATSVDDALRAWSDERTESGNHLVRFGAQLGRALVTQIPDWSHMDPASMERWFASIVTIRESMFATSAR